MAALVPLFVATFALVLAAAAADPDTLQDVCVADLTSGTPVILILSSFLFFFFSFLTSILILLVLVVNALLSSS